MVLKLSCSSISSQFVGDIVSAKAALVGNQVYLNYTNAEAKSDRYALSRIQRRPNTAWGSWANVAEDLGPNSLLAAGFTLTLVDEYLLSIGSGFARKLGSGGPRGQRKRNASILGEGKSHKFDLTEEGQDALEQTWSLECTIGGVKKPFRISYHSADYVRDQIYIFGGMLTQEEDGERTSTASSSLFGLNFDADPSRVFSIVTKGRTPTARLEHQSCCVGSRYLYVYGGLRTANGQVLSDVHRLNLDTNSWSTICGPRQSSARFGGAMCYFPRDKSVYVFGGSKRAEQGFASNSTCERIKVTSSGTLETVNIAGDPLPGGEMCLATDVVEESMFLVSISDEAGGAKRQPKLYNIIVVT